MNDGWCASDVRSKKWIGGQVLGEDAGGELCW